MTVPHVSDEDLIRAVDGELPAAIAGKVRAHLDECQDCSGRMARFENTLAEFRELGAHETIPAPELPRARLRARLRDEAIRQRPAFDWRRLGLAAAGLICVIATIPIVFQSTASADARPRVALTPGEVRPITLTEVCRSPDAQVVVRDIPTHVQHEVFAAYGIKPDAGKFEVDYLITPDLGGADSVRNMWPQPYSTVWNARVKDKLEQRLHQMVCEGRLDLATAQRDLAADWIGAYRKYVPR